MTGSLRNTIAVAIAVWLGATPVKQLTGDGRYLMSALLVVFALQGLAGLARRFTVRAWAPSVAQGAALLVGSWAACQLMTGQRAGFEPWAPVGDVLAAAFGHLGAERVPVGTDDATLWLLLGAVGLLTILTDLLFIAARSVLWALLPVTVGYGATLIALPWPAAAWALVAVAVGWLVLLGSRAIDHEQRWPRGLSRQAGARLDRRAYGGLASGLGAVAIAATLVAGLAVPADGRNWASGERGTGTVQLTDPSIQLNQNLRRPEERPVLSYTTTADGGVLLRSSTLTRMDANGWHQIDMSLQRGFPNRIPGLDSTEPSITTQVSIGDFESTYLPAPYAPVSWDAAGQWNYDPVSLTVLSVDRELGAAAVRELDYTVESRPSAPTADELAAAIAGTPPEGTVASQSADAPAQIAELASQITAAASTDGERAVLLQNWLRDPERFDYDLNAPEGTGYDSLVSFLFTERRGYCVHFAASMALMSRQVGIPARVAVGFTTGAPQADGSFVVTSHNMHAWPELYFAGLGWVRFEPTASVGAQPDWTELPEPAEQSAPSPTPTPTTEPSPVPQPDQETADDTESDEQSGLTAIDWRWPAGVVGALLLLVGPGLARALLRRHRLAATTPETRVDGAWRELRASAIDLGLDWPDLTPRQLAGASWPGLNTAGRQGLRRIALLVERRDYSPGLPGDVSVADDVRLVTEQWRASRNRWRQLWTRVVPRSLLMDVRWPWAE